MAGYIRPAQREEVAFVADNLRPADHAEVLAVSGDAPKVALLRCFDASRMVWAMGPHASEPPTGLLGVQDIVGHPEVGVVWMVSTPAIDKYGLEFAVKCREHLPMVHQYHPILTNFVDARNTVHIKWLRWMGFSFLRRVERWGAESRPFYEFARLQPKCVSPYSERP